MRKQLIILYLQKSSRSSMDRIMVSGTIDRGSNPFGSTLSRLKINLGWLFCFIISISLKTLPVFKTVVD
jgi:hypothetical protein